MTELREMNILPKLVILVSALGPNPSFFLFLGTFIQLGGLFGPGQGLGLGPGLDNFRHNKEGF